MFDILFKKTHRNITFLRFHIHGMHDRLVCRFRDIDAQFSWTLQCPAYGTVCSSCRNFSGQGPIEGSSHGINIRPGTLLDPASWEKSIPSVLNFRSVKGEYGPGHNSYFTDEQGKDWILFHAVDTMAGKRIAVGTFAYPENLE